MLGKTAVSSSMQPTVDASSAAVGAAGTAEDRLGDTQEPFGKAAQPQSQAALCALALFVLEVLEVDNWISFGRVG